MSMLTPPGMGGKYRVTGDRYPRMRRPRNRRKIVLLAVASVTALGVTGWGTLQLIDVFTGDGGSSAQAANRLDGSCEPSRSPSPTGAAKAAAALPKPGSITVNVLNATEKSGLAADTAKALKKRGFKIGKVANASGEFDKKVKVNALLIGATGGETVDRQKVLGFHVKGAETRYDHRKGDDIDLVIGKPFRTLTPEREATKALTAVSSPAPRPGSDC